jgi:chromosome segregation ATPase
MAVLGLAFRAATLGAYGLGSRLSNPSSGESTRNRLAAGSLALLHARMEQQALMASLMSSGNAEISTLREEVTALETKLNNLLSEVENKKHEIDELTKRTTDSESNRKALLLQKPRLEKISKAFDAALAKKKEADAARNAAMGTTGTTLTPEHLEAWKEDWKQESNEADDAIEKARFSLEALRTEEDQWNKGKDTLSPDQQKQLIEKLESLHKETTDKLKDARVKAAAAVKNLIPLIEKQRQQLEKATAAAPPP